jgi:hypothetical protein
MRVMFFETRKPWPHCHGTALELMQDHIDRNDEVTQAICTGELLTCDFNLSHDVDVCTQCIKARDKGVSALSIPVKRIPLLCKSATSEQDIKSLPAGFTSYDELTTFYVDNYDIGYGIASSVISRSRNPQLDVVLSRELIAKYLESAVKVYRTARYYLETYKPDRVYVFNGRFVYSRAIFRACQAEDTECVIYERGCDIKHYELYKNTLPHDLKEFGIKIISAWDMAEKLDNREEIGARFYSDRVERVERRDYSYTKNQDRGMLPDNWNPDLRNIVIFNSSEDEFKALGEGWKNPLYVSQLEGMQQIVHSMEELEIPDIHITLRVHPNYADMARDELKKWYQLESDILTVISYDSPVDTYALLRNADTVLTFGSTVGIEAVFFGKPSVLGGISWYKDLGGTYNPGTHGELIELLSKPLQPKPKLTALKYGYYMQTYGIPYKHYKADGIFRGKFKGVDLGASTEKETNSRLLRIIQAFHMEYTYQYIKANAIKEHLSFVHRLRLTLLAFVGLLVRAAKKLLKKLTLAFR